MCEMFVNNFLTRINGIVADSELPLLAEQLTLLCGDYDISRRVTAVVPYCGLPEAYKAYMVTKKIEGKSDKTLYQYRLTLEPMLNTIRKPLDEITTADLRIYLYNLKKERKIADVTLNNVRAVIRAFFSWCSEEGYIRRNVCAALHAIKYEEKPRMPYSDVQLETLRSACATLREKAIVEVLFSTGCRVAELAGLKKSDVDFKTREVHLFGKGKKHRVSYINARAGVALQNYFETRDDNNDALFVSERKPHKALSVRSFQKIMETLGERAQIEKVHPHRMRHTFATTALEHGMPVTDLQKLMGHASLNTTMVYAKVSQAELSHSYRKYVV